jgi:MGT family glycosyltransferase
MVNFSLMSRIAVVNVPFYSHVGALTRLTDVLVRQGHEVLAWAPEVAREEIEVTGASFAAHLPQMPNTNGFDAFAAEISKMTESWAEIFIDLLFAYDPDLVIHDSQVPWVRVAADYLGIPRIVSHPMFPIVSPEHIASDEELDRVLPDPTEAQAEFRAGWLSIARRWGVELGRGGEAIHSSAETMFAYTTPEIVGESQLDPAWRLIGPLMSPIPRSDPGDRPLVYVCFGTSFNKRMQQFTSVIEALADEPVDVLISTGKSTITTADLGPLPANIVVREFVEAREVLSRASAHITHGGCNSIHESLLAGVPMLCIPQAYDQFPLAGRMSVLGAGRTSGEDPREIRAGVRWLVMDKMPRARAEYLRDQLLAYDGQRRVAEAVDGVLARSSLLNR